MKYGNNGVKQAPGFSNELNY